MTGTKRVDDFNTCAQCGKELKMTPMPFECSYCGKTFCSEHRLPESHHCELDHSKKARKIEKMRKRQGKDLLIGPPFRIDLGDKRKRKKWLKRIVVAAILLVAIYFLYNYSQSGELQSFLENVSQTIEDSGLDALSSYTGSSLQAPEYSMEEMEKNIHGLINDKRNEKGLSELKWNDDIAKVAMEHSNNLATENAPLTDPNLLCPKVIIHHEGFDFGLYQNDRLQNRGIHYFGLSAENIFAEPMTNYKEYETYSDMPDHCPISVKLIPVNVDESQQDPLDDVRRELSEAKRLLRDQRRVEWSDIDWKSQNDMESDIVDGWMGSPGHRKNILTAEFDETGIGISGVNDYFIVTQVFIERADCGFLNATCCEESGYYSYCYEPLKCVNNYCRE